MTSVGQQWLEVRIPALPPLAVWPWQVTLKLSLFYYERCYKSRDDPPSQTHCILLLFSRAIVSNSLQPRGLQHARLPCPSLSPRVCSNSCPLSRWCYPTISSSVTCFSSWLQSFPLGSFPMSWLFASGGQSFGASASASVLPMNIQGWLPLGLTGLISVLSKGLSRGSQESSPVPQFESINSLLLSLLYGPTLTSIHDYWKNQNFDYMDLCVSKVMSLLFNMLSLSQLFFQGASVF